VTLFDFGLKGRPSVQVEVGAHRRIVPRHRAHVSTVSSRLFRLSRDPG